MGACDTVDALTGLEPDHLQAPAVLRQELSDPALLQQARPPRKQKRRPDTPISRTRFGDESR